MILNSEEVITRIHKLSTKAYWLYDCETKIFSYTSDFLLLCFKKELKESMELSDFINIIHDDNRSFVRKKIKSYIKHISHKTDFEFRIANKYFKCTIVATNNVESNARQIEGLVQEILIPIKKYNELISKNERLDFVIETNNIGIWELDVQKDSISASDNVYRITQTPFNKNFSRIDWSSHVHEDDFEIFNSSINSCIKGETLKFHMEYRYKLHDGSYIWLSSVGAAKSRHRDKKAYKMLGVINDITARKEWEERLKISENRLLTAQRQTKIGNWEVDLANKTVYWSDELYSIFGIEDKTSDVGTERFLSLISADDLERVKQNLQVLYKGGEYLCVFKILTESSKIKYLEENAFCERDNKGKIIKYIGTTQDITESMIAEEKIVASEARLKEAQRMAKIGNWELSADQKTLYWSEEAYRLFGYEPYEVEMTLEFKMTHMFKEDQEKIVPYLKSLENGETHSLVFRILSNDGFVKYIKDTSKCKKDSEGNILSYVGHIQDITEIKLKEREIIDSRERLRTAAELAKLGYWEYFVDTQKLYIHELYSDRLDKKVLGKNPSINDFLKLLNREDKEKVVRAIRTMIKFGNEEELTICLNREDGELWMALKGSCYYANGNLIKLCGHLQDVTERHLIHKDLIVAKEKAEESDRLKSSFLANMSHEIRTPMNSIIGFSSLLTDNSYSFEERSLFADKVRKNGEYLFQLITDILDLSLIETNDIEFKNEEVSINNLLDNLYTSFISGENINNQLSKLDNDIHIHTDIFRLSDILKRFLSNANKYTHEGVIEIGARLLEKDILSLYVKDTGIGIAEGAKYKIFDRFQQESQFTNGVGLGLSICKGLAERMAYTLKLESQLGEGSIFSVEINL